MAAPAGAGACAYAGLPQRKALGAPHPPPAAGPRAVLPTRREGAGRAGRAHGIPGRRLPPLYALCKPPGTTTALGALGPPADAHERDDDGEEEEDGHVWSGGPGRVRGSADLEDGTGGRPAMIRGGRLPETWAWRAGPYRYTSRRLPTLTTSTTRRPSATV